MFEFCFLGDFTEFGFGEFFEGFIIVVLWAFGCFLGGC